MPTATRRRAIGKLGDLRDVVESRGGVYMSTMGSFRDLQNAGKLGIHVVTQIQRSLNSLGLAILLPEDRTEVPRDQNATVLVYSQGSRAAELIEAVRRADAEAAKTIRQIVSDDSAERLDAIRTLLDA